MEPIYKKIELQPNDSIELSNIFPIHSTIKHSKKVLDISSFAVPISISLSQMNPSGNPECNYDINSDSQNVGCDYNNLESPNAYQCGLRCWSSTHNY